MYFLTFQRIQATLKPFYLRTVFYLKASMKRKLAILSLAMIILLAAWLIPGLSADTTSADMYTKNPKLTTVNLSPSWKGTPVSKNGTYRNLSDQSLPDFSKVLKWKLRENSYGKLKKADEFALPTIPCNDIFDADQDMIVWLGHASFLIRVNGVTFLTDPVFYNRTFLKRLSDIPFDIDKVRNIDYILLSHGHFDHCDRRSLKKIAAQNPGLSILCGLGMDKVVKGVVPAERIQCAGWYQEFDLLSSPKVTFLPSKHWTRRSFFDQNKSLWGGFYIKSEDTSVYFMGDSGYDAHFNDIRHVMGAPDFALMGIGAFEPQWFMEGFHISPLNAIRAFNEMKAKCFIPMHYGTFDLSDEPLLEPVRVLEKNKEAINGELLIPKAGEIVTL